MISRGYRLAVKKNIRGGMDFMMGAAGDQPASGRKSSPGRKSEMQRLSERRLSANLTASVHAGWEGDM